MTDGVDGALEGLTVIDLTQMLAGPYCTQLLADQGATVIKVEPLEGEHTRTVGPYLPEDGEKAFSGYFQSINRNKLSLALNLKIPEGRAILKRLVEGADVLVENFRAGVMERLELSYEALREVNPRLVYAAIRGFGDPRTGKSPYVAWPAFDVVAQAMGGIMGITGPDAETPLKVGPGVGDIVPAMQAAIGILAAVHRAGRTGRGQFVDVAMTDGVLALCERIVYQHSYRGDVAHPEGNRHPLFSPFGMFPARDGWVTIACPQDEFWEVLCNLIGKPELAGDERFATNEARVENNAEVSEILSTWSGSHTKKELIALLGGHIPFAPVYTVADILEDEHFRVRGMIAHVELPGLGRTVAIAETPIHMTETPGGVRRRAPLLGEHTDEVLARFSFSQQEIGAYRAAKVVA